MKLPNAFTKSYKLYRATVITVVSIMASGCYITSPFWLQTFNHTTDEIPVQVFTPINNTPITVECIKASGHGGPMPGYNYQQIALFTPGNTMYDSKSNKIYPAGGTVTIPSSCWTYSGTIGKQYKTNVRVSQQQGTTTKYFNVFDKDGLECLGKWTGRSANWFSAIGKGCEEKFINSNSAIEYLVLYAKQY